MKKRFESLITCLTKFDVYKRLVLLFNLTKFVLLDDITSVTNIRFVPRLGEVDVIPRHREIVSSKGRRYFASSNDFRIIEI